MSKFVNLIHLIKRRSMRFEDLTKPGMEPGEWWSRKVKRGETVLCNHFVFRRGGELLYGWIWFSVNCIGRIVGQNIWRFCVWKIQNTYSHNFSFRHPVWWLDHKWSGLLHFQLDFLLFSFLGLHCWNQIGPRGMRIITTLWEMQGTRSLVIKPSDWTAKVKVMGVYSWFVKHKLFKYVFVSESSKQLSFCVHVLPSLHSHILQELITFIYLVLYMNNSDGTVFQILRELMLLCGKCASSQFALTVCTENIPDEQLLQPQHHMVVRKKQVSLFNFLLEGHYSKLFIIELLTVKPAHVVCGLVLVINVGL